MTREFESSSHCSCNFLIHFDLLRIINNENIATIDVICEKLIRCLSDKQLRQVLQFGIEKHFAEYKDCEFVKSVYNGFSEYHQTVTTSQNQNRFKYCNETLAIRDLLTNLFNYLDYATLRECSKVSLSWFFASEDSSSLYCFDTSMINKKCRKLFKFGNLNLLRFKTCRKIIMQNWPIEQFPEALDVFDNIQEIDVNGSLKLAEYPTGDPNSHRIQNIGMRVLKNNVDKIEKLRFIGCGSHGYKYDTSQLYKYQFQINKDKLGINDLYFPYLVQLSFKHMRLGADINILDILHILKKNSNSLNTLIFESCVFSLDFWTKPFRKQEIIEIDKDATSGLKHLKLNSVRFCMPYPSRYSGCTKIHQIKGCVKQTVDKMALLFSNVEELEWCGRGFHITSQQNTGSYVGHIDCFYEDRMDDVFSYFVSQILTQQGTIKKITFERFGCVFYMNDFSYNLRSIGINNNLDIKINNIGNNDPFVLTIAKRKTNINSNCDDLGIGNDNINIDDMDDNVDRLGSCKDEKIDHEEHDDEWGMGDDEFEDDDDDDWGSVQEIDVFDENGMDQEITLNVGDPLAISRYGRNAHEDSTLTRVPPLRKLDISYRCKQHGREYLHERKFQDSTIQGYEYFCNGPGCNVADVVAVQTHELGSNMPMY